MKKIILLALSAAFGLSAYAQDIIVLKDATEIQSKVENITTDQITYHKWSNLTGPSYTISKSSVLFIKYENGEKEVFTTAATQSAAPTTAAATTVAATGTATNVAMNLDANNPRAGKVTFQGYANAIALASGYFAGPAIDVSLGARFFDYAYLGAELGFDYLFFYNSRYSSGYFIPVGLNVRGYCPTRGRKIYPFGSLTIGAAIGEEAVFHCQLLAGADFGRLSLGVGWDRLVDSDSFVFKIGVRFGK